MSINTISALTGTPQQQGIKNASAKLLAAITSIVSGTKSADVANVSIASQLQSQTNGLKQLASNLAQGSSLAQVADGGAEQIANVLTQLQSLAQTAQLPTSNSDTRSQLNQQFKQLLDQVDQIATTTSFNGKSLLDGSLSENNALSLDTILSGSGGGDSLSISSLTSGSLLGQGLTISSADSAGQSLTAISNALSQITGVRADIGAFQQTLDLAQASVSTAVANQEAAQSNLTETDFASASTNSTLADIQQNASIALAAQTNRLSPAILQLIG